MITSTSRIRVRYAETDKMGIVYHANYFTWFELTRVEMLDRVGFPYRVLEDQGYLLPVLDIRARFIQPARFDDIVDITACMVQPPKIKIVMEYEVRRGDDLLAMGESQHAFMSPEGRAIKPPKEFVDAMAVHYGNKATFTLSV